jgi:hypothetical protein
MLLRVALPMRGGKIIRLFRLPCPLLTQDDYHPGWEFDGALGTFYDFGPIAFLGELAPFLTLKGTDRAPDSGLAANPPTRGRTSSRGRSQFVGCDESEPLRRLLLAE